MKTRQRKWQIEKQKQGLCITCGKPADSGNVCSMHREQRRASSRNHYRAKHGIPLDAPLKKRGRGRYGEISAHITGFKDMPPETQAAIARMLKAAVKFIKNYPTRK